VMKLLITGGTGHIGSYFIQKLLESESLSQLVVVDNFSAERYVSIIGYLGNPKLVLVRQDFRQFDDIGMVTDVDAVIHMAAITDAAGSFSKRELIEATNLSLTKAAVALCERIGKPLIFFSSTSVYGKANGLVFEDDQSCLNPQSPYAETKLKEERLIRGRLPENSLILRLGTIFGYSAGIRFHTAVNKFCLQACIGEPLTVWETALDQVRPYLALSDCFSAVNFCLNHKAISLSQTFNVLTGNYSVRRVLDAISVTGIKFDVDLVKTEIMNQLSYEVSPSKLRDLGFMSEGCLEDSVAQTVSILLGGSS